jgi:acetolactate synthase-1/3 small subunit
MYGKKGSGDKTLRKHIIGLLVEDEPGVMVRIASMFSRRGFNIDTISVGKTNREGVSQIIVTLLGDDRTLEQVEKQLNKLVDVIKLTDLNEDKSVVREHCLVKIAASNEKARSEILSYSDIYRNSIVDLTHDSVIVEMTGQPKKVDAFLDLMKKFGIREISRTGVNALLRSTKNGNNT